MTKNLIAVLGAGKGTWGHLARLIDSESFGTILLVSNDFGKENFKPPKPVEWLLLNSRSGFEVLKNAIKEKLPAGDLAVSIISGTGKEHMALLTALKDAKVKFEYVVLTGDGTKYY